MVDQRGIHRGNEPGNPWISFPRLTASEHGKIDDSAMRCVDLPSAMCSCLASKATSALPGRRFEIPALLTMCCSHSGSQQDRVDWPSVSSIPLSVVSCCPAGPQLNPQRDPRWGRNDNSPGEDAWLEGQYGAMMVLGGQLCELFIAATCYVFAAPGARGCMEQWWCWGASRLSYL